MALFRRPVPRRAAVGAFLGFLYGVLTMLNGTTAAILQGAGWALLSVSLLFARAMSYYVFVTWSILWVVWKSVLLWRGEAGPLPWAALDVAVPLAALALVSASGYLELTRGPADDNG